MRWVQECEPRAVRLPVRFLVRSWLVPSVQSREPLWEVSLEPPPGTLQVKRSIRRRGKWRQYFQMRPLPAGSRNSDSSEVPYPL